MNIFFIALISKVLELVEFGRLWFSVLIEMFKKEYILKKYNFSITDILSISFI